MQLVGMQFSPNSIENSLEFSKKEKKKPSKQELQYPTRYIQGKLKDCCILMPIVGLLVIDRISIYVCGVMIR